MERKYSVITGFMGQIRDRFVEYQPPREMEEMLEMISRIKGCKGIEAVYPQNFQDAEKLKKMLNDYHLDTAAVNLNIKGEPRWRFGTFSSPDPATRRQAVDILKDAMDCAALLGCNLVQTALLNDGSDYAFELDYPEKTADAKITEGFNLPAKYVVHTVGPIVKGEPIKEQEKELARCYLSCLELTAARGIQSIAFCCISTGVFAFPKALAAEIAVSTVLEYLNAHEQIGRVIFNVFTDEDYNIKRH